MATTPKTAGSPFFAMYVQATRKLYLKDGTTTRKQWMVFPPLTDPHAKRLKVEPESSLLLFTRSQETLSNRVKWKSEFYTPEILERDIDEKLNQLREYSKNLDKQLQWEISPIIVVQVTAEELLDTRRNQTTPYYALKRVEKVASRKFGLAI